MKRFGVTAAITLCVLACAAPALAAGNLEVVGSKKISISAFTDNADSFVGSVTLHATAGDVTFTFVPRDLAGPNSTSLDRSHLTLLGGTAMTQGSYEVVTVKVAGVTDPGTYTGKVTIVAGDQSLDIPVTLVAKERPALAAATGGQLKLDVTRCGGEFSCWVAGWLIPDGGKDGTTNVLVTNTGKADDQIDAAQVFANGGVDGHTLSDKLAWTGTVAAGTTKALPLTVKREALPPDHYTGNAYVTVHDGTAPLTVPVDISVRSGPLWAILALLFGILVGRLAVHMQTRGNQQTSFLLQVYALRARAARQLSDPDDQAAVAARVSQAEASVFAFQFDGLASTLTEIGAAIDTLARAHEVDLQLQALSAPPAQAAELVAAIRNAIRNGQYDVAKTNLATLEGLLPAAPASARGSALVGADAVGANLQMLGLQVDHLVLGGLARESAARLHGARTGFAGVGRAARRVLYWLAGIYPAAGAEARLWIVRPLLAIILVLLLVGLGLKTLYVSNASFGSGGFIDYFGLILWGLSADVAARTLTTLGGSSSVTSQTVTS